MPASSKHKYSKILAVPDTYHELIINLLQSVELFCAYVPSKTDLRFPYTGQHGHGHRIIQETLCKFAVSRAKNLSSNNNSKKYYIHRYINH